MYYSTVVHKLYSLVMMISQLSAHVKTVYKVTRLSVAEDTWPPEQPKEFTPLMLLHHEDEHRMRDVTIVTEARVTSSTSNKPMAMQPSLYHHNELKDAVKASKTTTEISEILAHLEVSNSPQTILIEGAPGIGKTILLKHIAYSWAELEILKRYELVLLVYLRDPRVQKMSNLEQLFQYFCKSFGRNAARTAVTCSEYFLGNHGLTLILLIDGYDELPEDLRDNSLIADILNRHVLPNCDLVVSSRPHASALLRKRSTLQVDILGFSEEQRKHYIEHSLNDQSQIKQLITYLEQHINISSLCYVPFNMVLLLFLYKQGVPLPNSATQLYNIFICLTIRRNLTKYGITFKQPITDINNLPEPYVKFIQQLSKLSLQALNNNQLIFTLDQIKQFCPQVESIPGALNAFGLLQAKDHFSIFQSTITFNFLHLSVQEFLAANHITTLTPDEELSILKQYFWSDIHSNMFTIYVSLTKGQRSTFKKFLSGGDDSVAIHSKFLNDKLKCIHLYRCFNEASDDCVCRTIEREFSDGIINFYNVKPSTTDIENIITFLTCSSIKRWKMLNLGGCNIKDAGLYMMHRMLQSLPITIEELVLSANDLSSSCDNSLADIVISCTVKVLDVNGNGTLGQTGEFYPAILSPSSMLQRLNVANTILSNKVSIMIFNLLQEKDTKLEWLDISDNEITDDSCDVIVKTLQVNNVLQHLCLNGNRISKQATKFIVNSLHVNNVLAQLRISAKDSTKILTQLQDEINVERRKRGVHVQLNITIGK